MRGIVVLLALSTAWATTATAQFGLDTEGRHGKKAQGAIVVRDDAPVYESKSSMEVVRTLKKHDAVAALHKEGIIFSYEFVEDNGRVQVIYPVKGSAKPESGWMDPEGLSTFTYDCGCEAECMPWAGSLKQARWNPCFQEARDDKLDRLRSRN